MSIICLLLGGFGFLGKGGVEVPILFVWAWGFFPELKNIKKDSIPETFFGCVYREVILR